MLFTLLCTAVPSFAQSVAGTLTGMNGPTFVAIDASRAIGGTTAKWLFVSEHGETNNTGGGRILRFNLANTAAAPVDIGGGNFTSPDGILVDSATGDLFIADRGRNRVARITNTGTLVMTFGSGTAGAADEMHGPVGLARDAAGAIYVAEHGETLSTPVGANGAMVSKYTISGTTATRVWRRGGVGTGSGQFTPTGPYGVAVSGSSLLVSDAFNSRVQTWDLNGNYQSEFSVGSVWPLGLSIDSAGNLWIAESNGVDQVQKATVSGVYAGVTLTGGLNLPFDAVVDVAANRAYVSDYNNDRVVIFDLSAGTSAAPVINSSASQSGTVGQTLTYNLTASNTPTSYAALDALPAGLSLNTTTGVVTGIPSVAGTTAVRFTATNATGTSAAFTVTFTIAPASTGGTPGTPALPAGPSITFFDIVLPTGGTPYVRVTFDGPVTGVDQSDFAVNSQGGANASITSFGVDSSTANSYALGFTFNNQQDGSVQFGIKTSGTGITGGGNAFRGAGRTTSRIWGTGPTNGSSILDPATANVTAGTATGNNVNFTVVYSASVTGVTADDFIITGTSAQIGTPTGSGATWTIPVTSSGTGSVTLTPIGGASANVRDAASNWFGGATNSATATISGGSTGSAPTIAAQGASGTVGTAINYQVVATGATSFSVSGTPALPAGLTLNATTGVVSGTPTASGTTAVNIQATNANGSATAVVTFNIAPAATGSAPTISAQTAPGTVGSAMNYQVVATGATSFAVSGTPALPAGLTLNATTGVVSGTPTASGTTAVNIRATNANGSATGVVTFNIAPAATGSAPTISAQSTSGTVGTALSYQVVASGATSYAVSGTPALPAGLALNATTGVISGTPTASGTTAVNIRATNANGSTTAVVTLAIAAAGPTGSLPVVEAKTVNGTVGALMSFNVIASNLPASFTMTGAPAGMTISSSGLVTGYPMAAGTFAATVNATNVYGTGSGTITFVIAPAPSAPPPVSPPPPFTPPPVTLKVQTVLFNTPVSAIIINTPVRLGATAPDSGLPVTYSIVSGNATLSGDTLTVKGSGPVVVRAMQAGDSTWAAASADITVTAQKMSQLIDLTRMPSKAYTDGKLVLAATSNAGLPITYSIVSGPATISGSTLTFTGSGPVIVRVSQAGSDTFAATESTMTINGGAVPRLINISSRVRVTSNDSNGASIAGFVVTGSESRQILIRAVGPGLSAFGIATPLSNPTLRVFDSKGVVVASNTGWANDAKIATAGDSVGAFKLAAGSADSAVLLTLQPGAYTAQVQSATSSGTALIEVYDVSANAVVPTKQLINISTRGTVGSGDDVLVGGFVVSGSESKRVLVRAIGPGLADFGVANTVADPVLKVYDSKNVVIAQNDNWGTAVKVGSETPATAAEITAANLAAGAFGLKAASSDAAVILTLNPGNYTAVVTGAGNSSGAAIVEVYEIPNP